MERGVLGVDREQQPSAPLLRRERELAGGNEALLVRERECDAALERPQRRADAGEADHGVEHHVRLRGLEQLRQVAAHLSQLDAVLGGERAQVGRSCRERTQLQLGVSLHDLDRLPADRAGGAEKRDSLHGHSVPYASAMTAK